MSRGFAIALCGGIAIIGLFIASVFYKQRGDHLEPQGKILKIRTAAADEQRSIAVADLRIQNDSDVTIVVRDLVITVDLKDGRAAEGRAIARSDIKPVFDYYKNLGEVYNDPLLQGTRISARQTADFMLVARFDVPEAVLADRHAVTVTVQDRSLVKFTLQEKRR